MSLFIDPNFILPALFFVMAIIYASVGHGGASGYLAVMALFSLTPEEMRPTALMMNIAVSSLAVYFYFKASSFSWALFWPLATTSIPLAYLGGMIQVSEAIYKPIIGLVLLFAAYQSIVPKKQTDTEIIKPPTSWILIPAGAGLGFLSGLTGVGGGIFLSPLLLFTRWAKIRTISGVAALFILVNSVMGLAGFIVSGRTIPEVSTLWVLAALAGGLIGAKLGSQHLGNPAIQKVLGVVLLIAGFKMLLTAF